MDISDCFLVSDWYPNKLIRSMHHISVQNLGQGLPLKQGFPAAAPLDRQLGQNSPESRRRQHTVEVERLLMIPGCRWCPQPKIPSSALFGPREQWTANSTLVASGTSVAAGLLHN